MGILAHGVFAISRKTRILVGVLILSALAGAAFWYGPRLFWSEKKVEVGTEAKSASLSSTLNALDQTGKDSDSDGIKDWEEIILRTDPNNPDSDQDGTPDAEEVAKNRDPLKKGPNDELSAIPNAISQDNSADNNLTYALTRNIFESGALGAIDEKGQLTSTEFLDKLSLPKNIDPETLLRPGITITAKDLRINQNNDTETVKNYFSSISDIYAKRISPHQSRGDLVILSQALEANDLGKLSELDPLITALDFAVSDIKNISVPSNHVSFAVQELNYLLETKRAIEIFKNTQNDPLATVVAIRGRFDLLLKIAKFHAETINGLYASGVRFNPS